MATSPVAVTAPPDGVWRVGRGDDPLKVTRPVPGTLGSSPAGNRFDSSTGDYGVLYFGTSLEACFGETLARLRPGLHLADLIADEWRSLHFMPLGSVPADWRSRRSAVHVRVVDEDAMFLDVEALLTHHHLRTELALGLASLGHDDLDIGLLRGADRRVTRLVSEWAYRAVGPDDDGVPVYAGIRYVSRLSNEWECWAVFDDTPVEVIEKRSITLDMPALLSVAEMYDLTVH